MPHYWYDSGFNENFYIKYSKLSPYHCREEAYQGAVQVLLTLDGEGDGEGGLTEHYGALRGEGQCTVWRNARNA